MEPSRLRRTASTRREGECKQAVATCRTGLSKLVNKGKRGTFQAKVNGVARRNVNNRCRVAGISRRREEECKQREARDLRDASRSPRHYRQHMDLK